MVKFKYKQIKTLLVIILCTILIFCVYNIISFKAYVKDFQQKHTKLAAEELEKDLYIKAKINLEKALAYNWLKNEEASLMLAKIYLNERKLSSAIKIIEENFDVKYSKKAYLFYANILEENGEIEKAIGLLDSYPNKEEVEDLLSELISRRSIISENITGLKFSTDLITAKYKNKWGYMDKKGQWIIEPTFKKATPFIEDLALVVSDGKTYFINKNGQKVSLLDKKSEEFLPYIKSKAAIKLSDKWVYVDSDFNIISEEMDYLGSYSGGHAPFKIGEKWGIIDSRNKEILYGYEDIVTNALGQATVNQRFFAKVEKGYFIYNLKGKQIAGPFRQVKTFSSIGEFAAVMNSEKQWGFIDKDGKKIIDYLWEDANSFSNDLAAVKRNEMWGFINKKGSLVIDCRYKKVTDFTSGMCLLQDEMAHLVILDRYKEKYKIFK